MKSKLIIGLGFIFLYVAVVSGIRAFSNSDNIGKVIVKKPNVMIERDGKDINVSGFGALLKDGDVVKTSATGKAQITLKNGDLIMLAQNTRLVTTDSGEESTLSRLVMKIYGKIRAQIQKTQSRNIRFATPNAVIGVKGTDFVVRYRDEQTTVATVEGLVNMMSSTTSDNIDIPPGKMSSVLMDGEVLSLSDIAGEIMTGVEIAGEKMKESDFSGERIRY